MFYNDAPTSSDATININENNQESSAGDRTPSNITYTFSSSDFAFSDTDSGDAITHVKIVSLPTRGDLSYNSSNITTTDYEIAIGDIGNLVYTPMQIQKLMIVLLSQFQMEQFIAQLQILLPF